MPNIYLNSSYWGKLTFSKLYFPSLKNSYPCQFLASSNLRWYYWNSKLLLRGFFFQGWSPRQKCNKGCQNLLQAKNILYLFNNATETRKKDNTWRYCKCEDKNVCNTNETIPRPNNNISDHEASLIQPRTARIP